MKKSVTVGRVLFLLLICFASKPLGATAWIDSAIADLTRQMIHARFIATHTTNERQMHSLGANAKSNVFTIVIDLSKWNPINAQADSNTFFFHKQEAQAPALLQNTEFNYQDSINAFNQRYYSHSNYVAYYNVVLENFPFNLTKDISTVNLISDNTLYNQLSQLNAVKNEDWDQAVNAFTTIISVAAEKVKVIFNRQRVLVYGSCVLTGYYGPKKFNKARFYANAIRYTSSLENEPWIGYLHTIPSKFGTPGIAIKNFQERNRDIALGIQHYLSCNLYNNCIAGSNLFANKQARWLHQNLSTTTNIDKSKLFQTCLDLNGISEFRAWQVLMAGYDDQQADMSQPSYFIYTGATNATLDKIQLRVPLIKRAEKVIKDAGVALSRDSVLYFGYLMYRDTAYWRGIPLMRRVSLIKTLTSAQCKDYTGISEANDPAAFCEILTLLLFDKLPSGEEKNFLALLKSEQLLHALSFRLDESTVGFFGRNNYTTFILKLCTYWRKAYPEKISATKNSAVNTAIFAWDDDFFNDNAWFSMNWESNTLLASQKQKEELYESSSSEMETRAFDVYDPVMVNPLNDNQTLGLPAGQQFVVPAIFMDWLSHKKTWADVGVATEVTLATVGMLFGVGEIYFAGNTMMRCVGILLTVANTSELILLNNDARQAVLGCFSTPQEGEQFLSYYHHAVMLLNLAVVGRDLITDFGAELRTYRLAYQSKQAELSSALGINSAEFKALEELNEAVVAEEGALEVAGTGIIRLWTQIDEFESIVQGRFATIYDIRVTYQTNRVRAGMAFNQNGILEFHLNIPPELQGQGIAKEIFRREITDQLPNQVKGWWKTSDDYVSGESINLTIFKQKIAEGFSPEQAAFMTPTGKILKDEGFGGIPSIITNTPNEVIILFNPE